jgi:hypothetical protein
MGIFDFLKNKPDPIVNIEDQKIEEIKTPLFTCHYCSKQFEVTAAMQFSVSVPSVHIEYHFQGIGVQCPKCFKTCIYG